MRKKNKKSPADKTRAAEGPTAQRLDPTEIASAFCEDFGYDADLEACEDHLQVARLVDAHLASRGRAGDWSALDLNALYGEWILDERPELLRKTICLVGMLGWMGAYELVERERVAKYLDDVERMLSDDDETRRLLDAIAGLLASGRSMLEIPRRQGMSVKAYDA